MTGWSEVEAVDEIMSRPDMLAAVRAEQSRRDPQGAARFDRVALDLQARLLSTHGAPDILGAGMVAWPDLPGWVRLQLVDVWLKWCRRKVTTCPHAPDADRAEVGVAALWAPDLVVCTRCAPERLRLTGAADSTCDRCGRVTEGPAAGDPMYAHAVTHGCLVLWWGECGDCRAPVPRPGGIGTSRKRRRPRAARRPRGS